MRREEVLEDLVEEGREDFVGLWEVIRYVREDLEVEDDAEVRRVTLGLAEEMLKRHGMLAGVPSRDWGDFLAWDLPPDQVIRRIEAEWLALGRDPSLWEVVWFIAPERARWLRAGREGGAA
jgi:hypothetical protein